MAKLIILGCMLIYAVTSYAEQADQCQATHHYSEATLHTSELSHLKNNFSFQGEMRLGDLKIIRQDIFPDPSNRLYARANEWHTPTLSSTILTALPFKSGELVTTEAIAEAERLLRARPHFYDAKILIRRLCTKTVDLDVLVREVWTLTPQLSASRSGGESEFEIGISDSNWRGSGRKISFAFENDPDETHVELGYVDRREPGKWLKRASVSRGEHSNQWAVNVDKPFYTLQSQQAAGVHASSNEYEQKLYALGEEISRFDVRIAAAEAFSA